MSLPIAIDLEPKDLATVLRILKQYISPYEVWAFGSRIKYTAKKFSDLDLAVITNKPLPLNILGELQEAFSASDLPIKVDVLDWSRIDKEFQEIIKKEHVVLTY